MADIDHGVFSISIVFLTTDNEKFATSKPTPIFYLEKLLSFVSTEIVMHYCTHLNKKSFILKMPISRINCCNCHLFQRNTAFNATSAVKNDAILYSAKLASIIRCSFMCLL